jgi:hypothetical protein
MGFWWFGVGGGRSRREAASFSCWFTEVIAAVDDGVVLACDPTRGERDREGARAQNIVRQCAETAVRHGLKQRRSTGVEEG